MRSDATTIQYYDVELLSFILVSTISTTNTRALLAGWKMPTFLAGKRTCLGKDMAMLSSSIMLLDFLDEFNVGGGEEAEVVYDTGLTLWSTTGMNIKVDARKN